MKPAPFAYHRPSTLDEAVELLAQTGGKVLAGGQSLVPIMSMRLASPTALIDINHLDGLDAIEGGERGARVGCLVRHAGIERDWTHGTGWSTPTLVRQAIAHVAHPAVRNRGTTVGSLVHADPAAEMPAVLCLLGGSVEAVSAERGRRTIAAEDFFVGPLESALAADEIAVAATFPGPPDHAGSWWVELSRRHGDYALAGVGAVVTVDERGRVEGASLALIGVGLTPVVVHVTDLVAGLGMSVLVSGRDDNVFGAIADRVTAATDPEGDIHASADYRAHLARVLSRRAVFGAARNAVDLPYGGDGPGAGEDGDVDE